MQHLCYMPYFVRYNPKISTAKCDALYIFLKIMTETQAKFEPKVFHSINDDGNKMGNFSKNRQFCRKSCKIHKNSHFNS